ncbi:hypothetical protein AVEN_81934-1 [Araneus ventricosus]|uniref:Uncharacterized protein n=1 Tax=Araneus ventricosus TaxID=182803 RepID=A0A4Y2SJH2_ARAVE|nr:hypothetical protein AVEN_81934-1 [Araneus ventricosus]
MAGLKSSKCRGRIFGDCNTVKLRLTVPRLTVSFCHPSSSKRNLIRHFCSLLWATSRSRVPVDGAAIASNVRESSDREQEENDEARMRIMNEAGLVFQGQDTR